MFRRNLQHKTFHNNLFICLTPTETSNSPQIDIKSLFRSLQDQIQKNTEKNCIRTRPVFYQRLQKSLEQTLRFAKDHNDQVAINQRLMMQQCRNYYHTRINTAQKNLYSNRQIRKRYYQQQSKNAHPFFLQKKNGSFFKQQIQKKNIKKKINVLMKSCQKQNVDINQVKKKLGVFSYFTQKSKNRLQKIKLKVQKNQKS